MEQARSMQTGDFDGDQVADLLVLFEYHIDFFLSSSRSAGSLPSSHPTFRLWWDEDRCTAKALRTADLDLDGQEELLVLCGGRAKHLYYERDGFKWKLREEGLGDMADRDLPMVHRHLLKGICSSGEEPPEYLTEQCVGFNEQTDIPNPTAYGMGVADFNNDGWLDVVITHDVGSLLMLRNDWKTSVGNHRFIAVKLVGHESNRYGVGSTLVLKARNMETGKNGTHQQFREVYSASHDADWWGGRDDRIIFGLGPNGVPESLLVRWPGRNKRVQVIHEGEMMNHINSMKNLLVVHESTQP